jgi:hypothetical protein
MSSELANAEAAALREHLEQCPDCGPLAQAEQTLDTALGRAMKAVPAPDGLRVRLLAKLDRQRDAWYRRYLVRRVLPLGAAAAAVLVLAVLGLQGVKHQRKVIKAEEIAYADNQRHHALRREVDKWLRDVTGQDAPAPPEFNYEKLEYFCVTELENRRVPTLFFARGEVGESTTAHLARVYVLTDKDFDLKNLEEQKRTILQSGVPGPVRAEVMKNRTDQKVMYLVLYTGSELRLFFDDRGKGDPSG